MKNLNKRLKKLSKRRQIKKMKFKDQSEIIKSEILNIKLISIFDSIKKKFLKFKNTKNFGIILTVSYVL